MGRRLAFAAVLLLLGLAPGSAHAEPATNQGWVRTGAVPTFVASTDRLYVAADLGLEQARAFVAAPGAVTFVEAALDSTVPDKAALAACPLVSPLVRSGELTADVAPAADCSSPTPLTRTADGTWTVALDPWPALGVAVIPVLTQGSTFRVAFDATKTTVASPAAAPPAVEAPPSPIEAVSDLLLGDVVPDASTFAPTPAATVSDAAVAATPPSLRRQVQAAPASVGRALAAASPPAAVVLPLVGLLTLGFLWRRPKPNSPPLSRDGGTKVASSLRAPAAAAFVLLPTLMGEATVYKFGLVLIVLAAAIGLHLLVNWAGELSLAHAPLIGLPAFVVGKLSVDHHLSPVYLLPVAVAVGCLAGAVVGFPAIRARGLQVALVTLAAGVAIDRFFFTREWVVGPSGGAQVQVPTLGPITFATARSLYPLLALFVLMTIAAAWIIYRSKLGRALLWIKAHPDAAAAFGVPVGRYRTLAYILAGAFAGFGGGLTAMWVQRLTPQAFPLQLSFTYLIIVALAGRGFVGGVAAAAAAVEGGRLFLASGDAFITYAAPIGLIFTLTQHRAGLNGFGRQIAAFAKERTMKHAIRPLVLAGAVLIAMGMAGIGLAWYHAGNTSQVWIQNQELISGGFGGLALVIIGVTLIGYDRVTTLITAIRDREPAPSARPLRARRQDAEAA
jgi:ABC-type branched-subunit amino acid transport system permease subunit